MTDLSSPLFELAASGVKAQGRLEGASFVVLAGSQARRTPAPSFELHVDAGLRQSLRADGRLVPTSQVAYLEYTVDVAFDSASAAAAVTLGRTAHGRLEWKVRLDDGRRVTLGEWAQNHPKLGSSLVLGGEPDVIEQAWPPGCWTLRTGRLNW